MLIDLNKQNLWVTSDTHYGHANICSATTTWKKEEIDTHHAGVRNFDSLEDMNHTIVRGINHNVKEDDILIHLGDWSFGGKDNIHKFRDRILCSNIFLCYGNHDHHIKKDPFLRTLCFDVANHVLDFKVKFSKSERAKRFFASHFAHRVWDKSHHGVMHIYGHSHSSLEHSPNGKSMDVGIDNAFRISGEYRPFNIREIRSILDKRSVNIVDHHNSNTN